MFGLSTGPHRSCHERLRAQSDRAARDRTVCPRRIDAKSSVALKSADCTLIWLRCHDFHSAPPRKTTQTPAQQLKVAKQRRPRNS
ncbi:unnamed protein product, partial [Iphiclides podalirius]